MFKKSYYLFFSLFVAVYVVNIIIDRFLGLSRPYFTQHYFSSSPVSFLVGFDLRSATFLGMLFLVSCLVFLYAEAYMSHYNNKKFGALVLIFVSSMVTLSLRDSPLLMFIGWDGLGLFSICLIMFYPNKVTIYNSVLTIYFNRLGDVVLIFGICIFFYASNTISISLGGLSYYFLSILIICALTKRAQFPFSSWLPAAISAPTPVSAIVHSSTLVTAGIYLVVKLNYIISLNGLLSVLFFIRMATFLLGGFIANLETDFKKIVAFSTISQIRIIILFCRAAFVELGLAHIFLHALFKTLLFCCAGLFFLGYIRDQFFYKTAPLPNRETLLLFLFLSIFRITGYLFSSSFYTKDMFIENFYSLSRLFLVFFLVGSCLTLFYCIKIIALCFRFRARIFSVRGKISEFYFIKGFCFFCLALW